MNSLAIFLTTWLISTVVWSSVWSYAVDFEQSDEASGDIGHIAPQKRFLGAGTLLGILTNVGTAKGHYEAFEWALGIFGVSLGTKDKTVDEIKKKVDGIDQKMDELKTIVQQFQSDLANSMQDIKNDLDLNRIVTLYASYVQLLETMVHEFVQVQKGTRSKETFIDKWTRLEKREEVETALQKYHKMVVGDNVFGASDILTVIARKYGFDVNNDFTVEHADEKLRNFLVFRTIATSLIWNMLKQKDHDQQASRIKGGYTGWIDSEVDKYIESKDIYFTSRGSNSHEMFIKGPQDKCFNIPSNPAHAPSMLTCNSGSNNMIYKFAGKLNGRQIKDGHNNDRVLLWHKHHSASAGNKFIGEFNNLGILLDAPGDKTKWQFRFNKLDPQYFSLINVKYGNCLNLEQICNHADRYTDYSLYNRICPRHRNRFPYYTPCKPADSDVADNPGIWLRMTTISEDESS